MSKPFGYVTKTGEFIGQNVLSKYALKSDADTSNMLVDDPFKGKYTSLSCREPIYNPLKLATLLELNTYHEDCVYAKAHDTAASGHDIKAAEDANESDKSVLESFFNNPHFDIASIFEAAEVDYQSTGYAVIEFIKEGKVFDGTPYRLRHIPAHTVRMHQSRQMFVQMVGTQKVYFKAVAAGNDIIDDSLLQSDLHKDNGTWFKPGSLPIDKRATEVLYFNRYSPRDWYYGIPQIIPAIGAITGDISRARYNTTFFDNYAVPSYAVFVTGQFKDEDEIVNGQKTGKTVLQSAIEQHFKELAENPHSTLILTIPIDEEEGEVKIEFKPLSVDIKEASFRLYRKDNRDEIIAKHRVPPYRVGVYETGQLAGNLGQESTRIYADSIVTPGQRKYENVINNYIINQCFDIQGYKFSFNVLTVDETVTDIDNCGKLMTYGAMTPNQMIRFFAKKYGLEESDHPAMNIHYLNGQPLDSELEVQDTLEVQKTLDDVVVKLLEVAEKNVSTEDGSGNTELIEVIKSLKGTAGVGSSS